jgi:protease IV
MHKQVLNNIRFLNPLQIFRLLGYVWFQFRNWRASRDKKIDAILLQLPGNMPALSAPRRGFIQRRLFGKPTMSLRDVDHALRSIADDPRPQTVIFAFSPLSLSLADLQTLRDSIHRFRQRGKRAIAFAPLYDTATYFVAAACDAIYTIPTGTLLTTGLNQSVLYQRDALAAIGVELEAIAISPYKTAYDRFTRQEPSTQEAEQRAWLLDSRYQIILNAIATDRGITPQQAQAFIDNAPYNDVEALNAGYIDAICNEEDLIQTLDVAHIRRWENVENKMRRHWQKRQRQYIAVIKLSGLILPGESGRPPITPPVDLPIIGQERAGDATIKQVTRQLLGDPRAAAVILYLDTPGGSALASEVMASALDELAKTRPLIAYMNGVAASGGYYVSTAAHYVIAQPGTITGSIGVITGKPTTQGLFEKLQINRIEETRGANAGLFSDATPLSDNGREKLRQGIDRAYERFLERVSLARDMTSSEVDAVGGGRVWTGRQALEHKLVDELGDFETAIHQARTRANLPDNTPVRLVTASDDPIPPKLAETADPAAWMRYAHTNLRQIYNGTAQAILPFDLR